MHILTIGFFLFSSLYVMSQPANDFLSVIHDRSSIREYTTEKVEPEKIEALLRAAMAAPSSRNIQPWYFYVIQDSLLLNELSQKMPTAAMLSNVSLAIVVCGDTTMGNPNEEQIHNWIMDCSAATQNILLAAHALNLGAVWTGVYPYRERIESLRNLLNIPDHIIPLSLVPIGYPSGDHIPKDKWDPQKIHWIE